MLVRSFEQIENIKYAIGDLLKKKKIKILSNRFLEKSIEDTVRTKNSNEI